MSTLPPKADINGYVTGCPLLTHSGHRRRWNAILEGAFALPMDETEAHIFRQLTDREPPPQCVREIWAICGRRSGKTMVAADIVAYGNARCKRWNAWESACGHFRTLRGSSHKAPVHPKGCTPGGCLLLTHSCHDGSRS